MPTGIYRIENMITGDFYIGSSAKSISSRWGYHKRDLRANKHHSSRLQNSWNKYGESSFNFTVLKECPADECIKSEQFYIDTLEPSFNMNLIAGNCSGRKFSEETKKKMSESAKKRGLNIHLLNQQLSKAIFNEFNQKQCTKCSEFINSSLFRKNSSYCLKCYSKTRPSRAKQCRA